MAHMLERSNTPVQGNEDEEPNAGTRKIGTAPKLGAFMIGMYLHSLIVIYLDQKTWA